MAPTVADIIERAAPTVTPDTGGGRYVGLVSRADVLGALSAER
jgi:hypothetical protein